MKKMTILPGFWLKVIAMVTMTFDHIGFFFMAYPHQNVTLYILGHIFRVIGRIALPLFVFLAVEGALNTKSIGKYISKLTLILVPILIFQIIAHFGFSQPFYQGNIFIDLVLGVIMIWALKNKKIGVKFIAIIPLIFGILSLLCFNYEAAHLGEFIWWFPYFLRTQYDVFSIALFLTFYLSYKIVPLIYKERGLNPELHSENYYYRLSLNLFSGAALIIVTLLYYAYGNYIIPMLGHDFIAHWDLAAQNAAMIAFIPIFLYNGRRGYNKKWFTIFSYLYYPMHLITIFVIFSIIMLL